MCLRLMTHKLAVGPADGDGLVSHSGAALPLSTSSAGLVSLWVSSYINRVNTAVRGWSHSTGLGPQHTRGAAVGDETSRSPASASGPGLR